MKIIELTAEHKAQFACCLEEESTEAKEAGPRRACWIERFLARGLRAKLAVDEQGTVGGMIQYLPIEQSTVDGRGLYFIPCIWVHGHKTGRGNFQGHGMGRALLAAAEADARALGATGMAAWGLWIPVWMKASWFKKHGYQKADRNGVSLLVWKPFTAEAQKPRWFRPRRELPADVPGKVTVTAFVNGWCMVGNLNLERTRRAAAEFGDRVVYREIDVSEHAAMAEWGRSDEIFINGKPVFAGPPVNYEKIRRHIEKQVRRL